MKPVHFLHLAVLFFLIVTSTGCGVHDKIDLAYAMRGGREKLPKAENVAIRVQIVDNRPVTNDVGKVYHLFGFKIGEITPKQDVAEVIGNAIERELLARGFKSGGEVVISGDLQVFYNQFKGGLYNTDSIADFALTLQVLSPNGTEVYKTSFNVQGIEPNIQVTRGHNAKAALEKALWNGIGITLMQNAEFISALYQAAGVTPP